MKAKIISSTYDLKTPKEGWLLDETIWECDAKAANVLVKSMIRMKADANDPEVHNYVHQYQDGILTIWDIHYPKTNVLKSCEDKQ